MKTLVIGVGAAGNKAALAVAKENSEIDMEDLVLINSTKKDIPADVEKSKDKPMVVILSQEDKGCGKERSAAKNITLTAIQSGVLDLKEKVVGYDFVSIIASLEGGTGSGASPIIAKYCSQMLGKNTHMFGFMGFAEDPRGLQNSVEYFQELSDDITIHIINNADFLSHTGNNNKFVAERMANEELCRRIRLLDGSMLEDSTQNIDSTDIYKVTNTRGYTMIGYMELENSLTDVNAFNRACEKLVFSIKSPKCDEPGQTRMAVILNLSPLSEGAIDFKYTTLKEAFGNSYETFTHKQYDSSLPEFIAVISAGQQMPLDKVKELHTMYKATADKVHKQKDSFFSEVASLAATEENNMFDMENGANSNRKTVSKEDFMKQFQTKPVSGGSAKKG